MIKKELVSVEVFEKENGQVSRDYCGRFIGIVNKEQTSAIVNNSILQKRLAHLETKELFSIGKYSDKEISNMRAVLVVNKIGSRNVAKFLYFTELLDSVAHSNKNSAHMLTKHDGYIIFSVVDKNGNYKT